MQEWLTTIGLRLKALWKRRQLERDLDDELAFHLSMRAQKLTVEGSGPSAAQAQARRPLDPSLLRESCRELWTFRSLEILWQDLRYAARNLAHSPVFTAVAVISLALGIGANSTIFSALNAVLFRPLPYRESGHLAVATQTVHRNGQFLARWAPIADVMELRKQNHVFEDIGLVALDTYPMTLRGAGPAERVVQQAVSPNLFPLLGVSPVLGRWIEPADLQRGEDPIGASPLVLSYGFWQRRFSGSTDILGKTLSLEGGKLSQVIGVMPPGFFIFRPHDVDVWYTFDPENSLWSKRLEHSHLALARLKKGVTIAQAQAEMEIIAASLAERYPATNRDTGVQIRDLRAELAGGTTLIYPLLGAVGFVLLIACANVANLLLARIATRQREMTVRACIGAGRVRLLRQLLTESLLLALTGGALGLLLTGWGIRIFRALAPRWFPGIQATSADPRVILFTLTISVVTGLLFGLAPAIFASRVRLSEALTAAPRRRAFVSGALVVAEVALAMVLLMGAGLMINTFLRLRNVNSGLNPKNVFTLEIFLSGNRYWQNTGNVRGLWKNVSPEVTRFYQQLLDHVRRLPGVESAGMMGQLPPGYLEERTFTISGQPAPPDGRRPETGYEEVSPGFFETVRIPLRRGRLISERDDESAEWVVVINEALAHRYFPQQDPLGKFIRLRMEPYRAEEDRPRQIVGIVGNVRHYGPTNDPPPALYASYLQQPHLYPGGRATGHLRQNLVIRTAGGAHAKAGYLLDGVRGIVEDLDKDQPVYDFKSMDQRQVEAIGSYQFYVRLLNIFAAIALIMAAIGIYGVVSYRVSERTREIGIRTALGAQRRDVLRLILRQGLRLMVAGIAAGGVLALALTRLIARLLFGVTPTDPVTFAAVSAVLFGVAVIATYLPARKAASADPIAALRYQ